MILSSLICIMMWLAVYYGLGNFDIMNVVISGAIGWSIIVLYFIYKFFKENIIIMRHIK
jgi:hypothetical protein